MSKNANIIFRINSNLKENVLAVCAKYNVSVSCLITAYLEDTAKKQRIPLNILGKINRNNIIKENEIQISFIKKCLDEIIDSQGKGDIKKAYLFGSYARGEQKKESDIDIRLEVGNKLTMIDFSNIRLALKERLGKDIDLISQDPNELDQVFYNQIKKEEICLYEQKR